MTLSYRFKGGQIPRLLFLFLLSGGLFAGSAGASGILDYGLAKAQRFIQEDANSPEAAVENGFLFAASFEIDDPGRSASGSLVLPNGEIHTFTRIFNSTNLFHTEAFDTEAELHEAYPFGDYTLILTVDGVEHTSTLELVSVPFPGAPHVLNYNDLQGVDAAESFSVEWAPVPEGTVDDHMFLEIGDYRSPEPWEPGTLTGVDTSTVVEGGTVEGGTTYESSLYFSRVVDQRDSDISGARGGAVVGTWTEFSVTTTGGGSEGFSITTSSLPDATLDEPYSVFLEANEPVFTWAVDDENALPEGIQLNPSTGELAGTPTEGGSFEFSVTAVSASFTDFDSGVLTLTVESVGTDVGAPVIGEVGFEGGVFSFVISSPEGESAEIEVSPDLKTWTPLITIAPVDGVIEFQDADAATETVRFYRARWE